MILDAGHWILVAGFRIPALEFRVSTLDFGLWALDFGLKCQPGCQILMGALLGPKPFRDQNDRALSEQMPEKGSEKGLGRSINAGAGQHSPILQAPCQGLHSGSFRRSSKQFACRCDCEILRQAEATSQARQVESTAKVPGWQKP